MSKRRRLWETKRFRSEWQDEWQDLILTSQVRVRRFASDAVFRVGCDADFLVALI